jgi:hypothetical protein
VARSARPVPIRAVPANVAPIPVPLTPVPLTPVRLTPVRLILVRLILVRLILVRLILVRLILVRLILARLILVRLILARLILVLLIPGSMFRRTPAVAASGPEHLASRMDSGRRARTVRRIVPPNHRKPHLRAVRAGGSAGPDRPTHHTHHLRPVMTPTGRAHLAADLPDPMRPVAVRTDHSPSATPIGCAHAARRGPMCQLRAPVIRRTRVQGDSAVSGSAVRRDSAFRAGDPRRLARISTPTPTLRRPPRRPAGFPDLGAVAVTPACSPARSHRNQHHPARRHPVSPHPA